MRIAVVEDDKVVFERINKALMEGFSQRGIPANITLVTSKNEFIRTASRHTFDLVFLDWHLPDGTGITLIDWMKKYLKALPAIVMVTHRQEEADVIKALDAGADDYISKPFKPRELAARAYAASRRKSVQQQQLTFGRIKLNIKEEAAYIDDQYISLTRQEFRLAHLLLSQLDSPLSRSYLYTYVWGRDHDLNTRTLDVHIHRVRKKLMLTAEYGWNLISVYGYGYRLQTIENREQDIESSSLGHDEPNHQ